MDGIPFLVAVPQDVEQETKGFLSSDGEHLAVREFPTEVLRRNLSKISHELMTVLADIKAVGSFQLSQVEIQVEINAEGGVHFIGTSKVGGKGSISLTFKQPL